MVLQDLDTPRDASFVEAPLATDADPYASGRSDTFTPAGSINFNPPGAPPAIVDLTQHTTSFTLPERALRMLTDRISTATIEALGRPARQDEAEAVVEYTARVTKQKITADYVCESLAIGTYIATRKSFLFPGWRPRESFDREAMGPLRGASARISWKLARFSAWFVVGSLVSRAATTAWGVAVLTPAYFRDPRMQDIVVALRDKHRQRAFKRENDTTPGQRSNETFEMARQRSAFQTASRERSNRSPSTSDQDDMSPTSGGFARDVSNYSSTGGAVSDGNGRPRESHGGQNGVEQQPRTGGTATKSSSQGSAWDQLRQQALSHPDSTDRDSPRTTTSNTLEHDQHFPLDYNQESARAKAQTEFDELVERERRGGDFDEKPSSRRG
jgi:hypothetical protein